MSACELVEGRWNGLPHWTCTRCRLDTLDPERVEDERARCPLPAPEIEPEDEPISTDDFTTDEE